MGPDEGYICLTTETIKIKKFKKQISIKIIDSFTVNCGSEQRRKASCLLIWTYNFIGKNQSEILSTKNIDKNFLSISKLMHGVACSVSNPWGIRSIVEEEPLKFKWAELCFNKIQQAWPECHIRYYLTTWVALSCSRGTWNYCQ